MKLKKSTKKGIPPKRRRELTDADVRRLMKQQIKENREALEILAKY
ncbi:hypothetical protein [Marinithermus hydrothermalis]|uniref:Uncharacterized protein n=1 Tax=Marinithermus hydrothermalis (strain DSM 14884 / JCM 11576 / T1) TaxID=869210 RepID=F2NK64_MARHT|nr:hypothetical protein [Marinithermus hydrothermalis]AEB12035.1 hypothetical protein Marky_1296 [Marinithermus hydrothermalis DSM 14884]